MYLQYFRDQKSAHTSNSHFNLDQNWRANHGCYPFSGNLVTGGIRDFLFFTTPFLKHVFHRNHHYNLDFFYSKFLLIFEHKFDAI